MRVRVHTPFLCTHCSPVSPCVCTHVRAVVVGQIFTFSSSPVSLANLGMEEWGGWEREEEKKGSSGGARECVFRCGIRQDGLPNPIGNLSLSKRERGERESGERKERDIEEKGSDGGIAERWIRSRWRTKKEWVHNICYRETH